MKKLKEKDRDKITIVAYTLENGPWQVRGIHTGSGYLPI